jgi:hypothetical protein
MIAPREIPENGPFAAFARKLNEIIRYVATLTPRPTIHSQVEHHSDGVMIRPRWTEGQAGEPDDLTWL